MLLSHPNIDVNECWPDEIFEMNTSTCKSIAGYKLLLAHPNIHVCKDNRAFNAVQHRQPELLRLIMNHPDFEVKKK